MALSHRQEQARVCGLAGLAFICSDYALYFVLEVRGYTLMLALLLAVVWLHLRWFARPSLRRALPYLLAQTALVYVQFTSGVVVALLGLRVVLAAPPGKRWRCTAAWVGIMLGTGLLFLPLLPQFLLVNRANANVIATTGSPGIDLDASLGWVLRALSARQEVVFVLLLALALGGLLLATWRGGRVRRANTLWLLVWALGLPAFAFVTLAPAGLFTPRYLLPALPGLLLLVGVGLAGWRAGWRAVCQCGAVLCCCCCCWLRPGSRSTSARITALNARCATCCANWRRAPSRGMCCCLIRCATAPIPTGGPFMSRCISRPAACGGDRRRWQARRACGM